jgi:Transglutaminase-like superfamily
MGAIATFLGLPAADRRLLLRALATVVRVRVLLRLQSLDRLRAWAQWQQWAQQKKSGNLPPAQLAWAVRTAARRMPGATCLVQALALQRLLSQQGHSSELHIGVARHDQSFEAHAWLTHQGKVLIGADRHEEFTPLVAWPSNPG